MRFAIESGLGCERRLCVDMSEVAELVLCGTMSICILWSPFESGVVCVKNVRGSVSHCLDITTNGFGARLYVLENFRVSRPIIIGAWQSIMSKVNLVGRSCRSGTINDHDPRT